MKTTKILALLLALCLMVGMFAGCGNSAGGNETTAPTQPQSGNNDADATVDPILWIGIGAGLVIVVAVVLVLKKKK